jgi:hypothetical protein
VSSDLTRKPEDPRGDGGGGRSAAPPDERGAVGKRCVLLVPTLFGDDP